jgi:hypothetical protein
MSGAHAAGRSEEPRALPAAEDTVVAGESPPGPPRLSMNVLSIIKEPSLLVLRRFAAAEAVVGGDFWRDCEGAALRRRVEAGGLLGGSVAAFAGLRGRMARLGFARVARRPLRAVRAGA